MLLNTFRTPMWIWDSLYEPIINNVISMTSYVSTKQWSVRVNNWQLFNHFRSTVSGVRQTSRWHISQHIPSKKNSLCCCWNHCKYLLLDTNVHDITIKTQCYSEILWDINDATKMGHPGMLIMVIFILEENVHPHVAHNVKKILLSKVLEGAGASSKKPRL